MVDEAFGHWLAGFVDGEGCFTIGRNGRGGRWCSLRIALRADDEPILRTIHEQTGLGNVWIQEPPSHKLPTACWSVTDKAGCAALVEMFERYPLRAKKRRDFETWARAVSVWCQMSMKGNGNQHTGMKPLDYSEMNRLDEELRAGRRFI